MSEVAAPSFARRALPALVVLRVLAALSVRTYFNPDEYWQGPEVAHRLAFGFGYESWEWAAGARLRGYTHPLLYAALFRGLAAVVRRRRHARMLARTHARVRSHARGRRVRTRPPSSRSRRAFCTRPRSS